MLERICALVGHWPEPDWSDAVRGRLEQLADAARTGRARGERLREAGGFWHARAAIGDVTIRAVIDDWIADFAPSYAALAAGDRSAEEASAGLVVDVELPDDVCAGRN